MITILHDRMTGVMRENRYQFKFLLFVFMSVMYVSILYSAPVIFELDSRLVLSRLQYPSSRSPEKKSKDISGKTTTQKAHPVYDCPSAVGRTYPEDLLCQKPPTFLPNFKNPCFYDASGHVRCLPYFHIFGVCKTGTTDLFKRMLKHPQIIPNRDFLGKETWYWTWRRYGKTGFKLPSEKDRQEKMSFRSYLDTFDSDRISKMKVSNRDHSLYSDTITGSGDPMDFWDQTQWKLIPQNNISRTEPEYSAPNLIKHVLPDIKLIVMLREPIDRLYSHYYHGSFGSDRESFHRDVLSALEVMETCRESFTLRSCLYNQTIMNQLNVPIYASTYHVHMKTWLDVFPRDQIHIIRTEDFSKDISGHMIKLFRFLNISDISQDLLQNIAKTSHARETPQKKSAGPMLPETWKILKAFFDKQNKELVQLLNNSKFSWEDIYLSQRKVKGGQDGNESP